MSIQVSIGHVKREISDLVNRVSYAGERIILTSHGKPRQLWSVGKTMNVYSKATAEPPTSKNG